MFPHKYNLRSRKDINQSEKGSSASNNTSCSSEDEDEISDTNFIGYDNNLLPITIPATLSNMSITDQDHQSLLGNPGEDDATIQADMLTATNVEKPFDFSQQLLPSTHVVLNTELTKEEVLVTFDSEFKRNMIDASLDLAKENLASFNEAMLDQVAVKILTHNFIGLNEDCDVYFRISMNINNLPSCEELEKDIKDFIVAHKLNLKELKASLRDAKSRLQRLQSNEKRLGEAINNANHGAHGRKQNSMMKMPRITLPSFQGGDNGTISWEVFRND